MAYASKSGHARVNAQNPRAFAVCDRCGRWYNWTDLSWQVDWRGPTLQNLRILVCKPCYDQPQEQLRAIVLPADPTPIINARPENFAADSTDYRVVSTPTQLDPTTGLPISPNTYLVTENCDNRTTEPYGRPANLDANAIAPLQINNGVPTAYNVLLPVLSIFGNGTATVTVTCSAVHNLQPGYQVAVTGMVAGNGFFTVAVPTATQFTYETYDNVPAESLMTATGQIRTANVGIPRGYTVIPQVQNG